jgi:hypothetical protein
MKLSEAGKEGAQLRPETHFERFCWIEGKGLCSDFWGAACEAVQPLTSKLNWRDADKFEHSMELLRATQQKYFQRYFVMPAVCPGSHMSTGIAKGHLNDDNGRVEITGEYVKDLPPITSECKLVGNVAGLADHLFYAHRWSREEVAAAIEMIEQLQDSRVIRPIFQHYPLTKLSAVGVRPN